MLEQDRVEEIVGYKGSRDADDGTFGIENHHGGWNGAFAGKNSSNDSNCVILIVAFRYWFDMCFSAETIFLQVALEKFCGGMANPILKACGKHVQPAGAQLRCQDVNLFNFSKEHSVGIANTVYQAGGGFYPIVILHSANGFPLRDALATKDRRSQNEKYAGPAHPFLPHPNA